jgi:RIO-like serine/threonine protein kinase
MKLDVNALRYITKEEFRALQAVELGQRNVQAPLSFTLIAFASFLSVNMAFISLNLLIN